MNDFLLFTNMSRLNDNGEKEKGGSVSTKKMWRWKEQKQIYNLTK